MTNRTPWTPAENSAVCSLYFEMLDNALRGYPYCKAEMIRHARNPESNFSASFTGELANRSRGSIEAKLMNCSAAHRDLIPDAETMSEHGYRPLPNYQRSLREAMALALDERCEREIA